jgi:cellulose biosynthesis protein BcsS
MSLLALGVPLPADAQVRSQPSMATQPSPVPGAGPWAEGWAGGGFQNNWYGGWLGVVAALNHSNVWADGFVARGEFGAGHYDYTNAFFPGNSPNVDVTYVQGAALLGYRKNVSGLGMLTGYVGVEVQNHDNPDPTAQISGTAVGVKFLGEIYNRLTPTMDFYGQASFSTAFNTWLALARPGFLVANVSGTEFWIGPEGQLFGNGYGASFTGSCQTGGNLGSCRYEEGKLGGFVHIKVPNQPLFGDWIIAGGYRQPFLCCSGNGYYVQVGLNFQLY